MWTIWKLTRSDVVLMKKAVGYIALVLVLALLALVLVSWLLSATTGDSVRSLLSSEGIRFFFGGFVSMLQTSQLIWLLLLAMAWGCLRSSGLFDIFSSPIGYRRRQALLLLLGILAVYVFVVALLTMIPHAVLLSTTGRLWPSAFSRALVPLVSFGIILLSTVYGLVSRRFLSIADVFQSLSDGIVAAAPLFVLYVLFIQLFESLRFVFWA